MTRYPVRPGVPSENCWPMVNRNGCILITAPGAGRTVPVRAGDVATVLAAFLRDYHATVEPIVSQVWGWSADNDVADSNHMSGTAVDVNAPQYPWGRRVMPAARIAKVRALLARYRGVVYWGADWNRADEMHYQIGVRPGDPRLIALAADIRAGRLGQPSTPAPTPGRPVLRAGDRGDDVRALQAHMNRVFQRYSHLDVDGIFGPATEAVIREAQRRAGIAVDGVVGPDTRRVILWP